MPNYPVVLLINPRQEPRNIHQSQDRDVESITEPDEAAALTEESMSRVPALTLGWFATIPIEYPLSLASPMTMFWAQSDCVSNSSLPSTIRVMISRISYALSGLSGRTLLSSLLSPMGGLGWALGGSSVLWDGMKLKSFLFCCNPYRFVSLK